MKRVKQLLLMIVCVLLLCGRVKEHTNMSINKDKSVNIEYEVLLSDKVKASQDNNEYDNLRNNATSLENKGYRVTPKTENGYSGYTISKKYKSIDDMTKGNGGKVDLSDFLEENVDVSKTFTLKKGFLKNVYSVSFTFEFKGFEGNITPEAEELNQTDNQTLEVMDETVVTTNQFEGEEDTSLQDNEADVQELTDLSRLASEMEFSYTVKLPYAATQSNAGKISNDKKELYWNMPYEGITEINYSFPVYNLLGIIVIGAGALLALIIIIVIIVSISKKKKDTKETLIHTDYDSSIVGQIDETSNNMNEIPQGPTNHEFSVPEPQVNVTQEMVSETPTSYGNLTNTQMVNQATTVNPIGNITEGPVVAQTSQGLNVPTQNNINQ